MSTQKGEKTEAMVWLRLGLGTKLKFSNQKKISVMHSKHTLIPPQDSIDNAKSQWLKITKFISHSHYLSITGQ